MTDVSLSTLSKVSITDADAMVGVSGGGFIQIDTASVTDQVQSATNAASSATEAAEHIDGLVSSGAVLNAESDLTNSPVTLNGVETKIGSALEEAVKNGAWNPRGAWSANTKYAVGDYVTYQGSGYVVVTAFTSGTTFDATNFTLAVEAGDNGLSVGEIAVSQGAIVAGQPSTVTATPSLSDGTALTPFTFQVPPGAKGSGGTGGSAATLSPGDFFQPTATYSSLDLTTQNAAISVPASAALEGNPGNHIIINPDVRFQEFYGCGGALTESAAIRMLSLSDAQLDALLDEMFVTGKLNVVRIGMGSTDFCKYPWYTYADNGGVADWSLTTFDLGRDRMYVIPVLQKIVAKNPDVIIQAAPWSPPAWMKTNGSLIMGAINGTSQVYNTLAQYFVLHYQAYAALGIYINLYEIQNEPQSYRAPYPCCQWTGAQIAAFIPVLGAAFDKAGIKAGIFSGGGDNWGNSALASTALTNTTSAPYVVGTSWHGYGAGNVPANSLPVTRQVPGKLVWMSEYMITRTQSAWGKAQEMCGNIIVGCLRAGFNGMSMWNLALDETGGPYLPYSDRGWGSTGQGIVTIPSDGSGNVVKNVDYLTMSALMSLWEPGCRVCDCNTFGNTGYTATGTVQIVGLVNPSGNVGIFSWNSTTADMLATVTDARTGTSFPVTLKANGWTTLQWGPADIVAQGGTLTAPGPVTSLAGTSGDGNADLTWVNPASTGSTALGVISIQRGADADSLSEIARIPGTATSFSDTTALSSTTYVYGAQTIGGGGPSAATVPTVSVPVTGGAPWAPTLSVSATGVVTATPAAGGSTPATFNVYRGTAVYAWAKIGSFSANGASAVTWTDSTAAVGTTCFYMITAVGSNGKESADSGWQKVLISADTTPFTTYSATLSSSSVVSGNPVTLTITPGSGAALSSDAVITPTSTVAGTFSPATMTIPAGSTAAVSCTFTPSAAGTASISTTNNASLSAPAAISLTVTGSATAPGAPGLTIVAGDGQITANVTAPTSDGGSPITGYPIVVNDAASPVTTLSAPGSYVITGLTNGTAVSVKAGATNSVGTTYSADQSATPVAPPAGGHALNITTTGYSTAPLTINNSGGVLQADAHASITALGTAGSLTLLVGDYLPSSTAPGYSSYGFYLDNTGNLVAKYSTGSAKADFVQVSASALPTSVSGVTLANLHARAVINTSAAAATDTSGNSNAAQTITFWVSPDGSTWTQLGEPQAATTALFTARGSVAHNFCGIGDATGTILDAQVYSGTTKKLDPDYTTAETGAATITDSLGNVWTTTAPATIS
ncbi:carbohydrate-binding protein [Acetobacter sicerae]|uniref:carbohydrate-binding protein n=1 Tax=Acetobacter sicerae TaxID=85325 RepID=UPI00156AED8A|nr:hypothetical protein [Acetobacter sicerae]NHN93813.1 hypothetical protein [Acetobacter sicerae]